MAIEFQLTIDCRDPGVLVPFWAEALGYIPQPPPDGFQTWRDWYR
ncbi:MAG: VOC family protein, partial [Dactylosporangium sp.]|nr:VOC family protein [Dactylosporangium sp.]